MTARHTRLLLDVTWDPNIEDKPTTWLWTLGYDPRPIGSIVVVGEVTGRDDELLTVLEELRAEMESTIKAARQILGTMPEIAGLQIAARMVQDAIDENTPEPPDLEGEDLFPARPVLSRDRLTDLALEAMTDG